MATWVAASVSLVLLGTTFATPARALDPPARTENGSEAGKSAALDLADQSETAYRAGHFGEAADLLRRAYAIHPAPVLLYNLARVEESAGNDEQARDAYQRYLSVEPGAPDRRAIEQRVLSITRRIEERDRAEAKRQQAILQAGRADHGTESASPTTSPSQLPPWIMVSVGSAVLLAGVTFGLLAKRDESGARDAPTHAAAMDDFEGAQRYAKWANVGFLVGGVTAAAGVTWLLINRASSAPSPQHGPVALSVAPGFVALAGRF